MESGYGKKMMQPGQICVNLIHYPVYTLGPGKRVAVWFQGCSIRCRGCIAPHTWESDAGYAVNVNDCLDTILNCDTGLPEGVTITGGEPFDQAEGLMALLTGLRGAGIRDIILYTGHSFDFVETNHPNITRMVDVIVEGPFVEGFESDSPWKGSQNQRMLILTKDDALRRVYTEYRNRSCGKPSGENEALSKVGAGRKVQILTRGSHVYVIGIPYQKDAEAIRNGFS